MARFNSAFALAAAALAATVSTPLDAGVGPANPTIYSVNQPVVQRTDYVLDLVASGGGLPAPEAARLGAWFESLQLGYGDRVAVDDAGYSRGAREDVARIASNYGLLVEEGAPLTAGAISRGNVRVIVSRTTAFVPNCPNWDDPQIGAVSGTSANFGCAVNSNVAAMIADPNDLVLGQTGNGDRSGATASKAIKVYRDAVPTGAGGLKDAKGSK